MNNFSRRAAAITVIGAVVLGGLSFAQAASADVVTTGTITLQGHSVNDVAGTGANVTSGDATQNPMFYGIKVSQGCPAGYRYSSNSLIWQGGTFKGAISTARTASTTAYGQTGLDGNAIAMDDSYAAPSSSAFVANKALNSIPTPLAAGDFEIRVYCFATQTANFATDKWFSLPLTMSADLGTWSTPVVAAPKSNTTASLTAASDQSTKKITLTATVKSGAATATDSIGRCDFFASDGTTVVGSGTVANGLATLTTGALAAGTYSYTAKFIGNNDPKYNDSAVSGSSSATINGDTSGASTVTFAVPTGVGSVTLSGVTASVSMGTAALSGGLLTATGTLPPLTVTDTRQTDAAAWSLTGQTSDFTAGAKSLSGKYLGWVPALSGSANAGTAGATVVSGTATSAATAGLKTASVLSSGSVVNGQTTTTTGATLNLAVPSNTPSGTYSAVLTLTLA